jgi:hypothetical protein
MTSRIPSTKCFFMVTLIVVEPGPRCAPQSVVGIAPRANTANNSNSARRNPPRSRARSHPSITSRKASVITASPPGSFWLHAAEIRRLQPFAAVS